MQSAWGRQNRIWGRIQGRMRGQMRWQTSRSAAAAPVCRLPRRRPAGGRLRSRCVRPRTAAPAGRPATRGKPAGHPARHGPGGRPRRGAARRGGTAWRGAGPAGLRRLAGWSASCGVPEQVSGCVPPEVVEPEGPRNIEATQERPACRWPCAAGFPHPSHPPRQRRGGVPVAPPKRPSGVFCQVAGTWCRVRTRAVLRVAICPQSARCPPAVSQQ